MLRQILHWLALTNWKVKSNKSFISFGVAEIFHRGGSYFGLTVDDSGRIFGKFDVEDIDGIAISFKHRKVYIQFRKEGEDAHL